MNTDIKLPLFLAHGQDIILVIHGMEVLLVLSIIIFSFGVILSRKTADGTQQLARKMKISGVVIFGIIFPVWLLTYL